MIGLKRRPNRFNVKKGDTLIFPSEGRLVRMIVRATCPSNIFASDDSHYHSVELFYGDCLIIKQKNNEHLFGENVESKIYNEGFGGFRLSR